MAPDWLGSGRGGREKDEKRGLEELEARLRLAWGGAEWRPIL